MLLFKKTKDPRGIIYCRLGLGEIALLKGKRTIAKKHILKSLQGSSENSFAVEKCHATTLMSYMNKNNPTSPPFSKGGMVGFSGKIDNGCYDRLGLKLMFQGLPLNIP
jgi:hypothetical protein